LVENLLKLHYNSLNKNVELNVLLNLVNPFEAIHPRFKNFFVSTIKE